MYRRIAIVTGAAHGIGLGIAQRLFENGYGVGLIDIDQDACRAAADAFETKKLVSAAMADVANPEAVSKAVEQIASDLLARLRR